MPDQPLRMVLDTNVVLSALVFPGKTTSQIRELWQSGKLIPLISRETTEELLAALQYSKFNLSEHEQQEMLAAYLPYCEVHAEPKPAARLPKCRDPDDDAFVDLAAAAKAECLISGDKDLHALKAKLPFAVLTPQELLQRLSQG